MDKIIKATYYGNTPETCRHIIRSYLEYSQFGKLIEEHPNKYEALGCFEDWWNEYISDGEDEFVEQDQTIEQLEAELEATRQKIAKQLSMVGRSIQSIDPTLYDKERVLEQAVIDAHLDAPLVEDGPIDMPSVAPAVMELLTPPVKRFFRNGVEHTLIQEQSNEEIDAFIERKILEEQDDED